MFFGTRANPSKWCLVQLDFVAIFVHFQHLEPDLANVQSTQFFFFHVGPHTYFLSLTQLLASTFHFFLICSSEIPILLFLTQMFIVHLFDKIIGI